MKVRWTDGQPILEADSTKDAFALGVIFGEARAGARSFQLDYDATRDVVYMHSKEVTKNMTTKAKANKITASQKAQKSTTTKGAKTKAK